MLFWTISTVGGGTKFRSKLFYSKGSTELPFNFLATRAVFLIVSSYVNERFVCLCSFVSHVDCFFLANFEVIVEFFSKRGRVRSRKQARCCKRS